MNILVVFSEALNLPVDNNETVQTYGLVLNKEHWESSPYKMAFLSYVRVLSEMCKEGFTIKDGFEFEKDGYSFIYGDLSWKSLETMVEVYGVQYAIVGECGELDEGDYQGEFFTNKDKWEEIARREGLVWER